MKQEASNLVIQQLDRYITDHSYCGNEPYDGLNTRFGLFKKTKTLRLFMTHFNRISPMNFRPALGIGKFQHTKALALLLSAYCNLYELTAETEFRDRYIDCRNLLLERELPTGGIPGSYDYQMRNWLASKDALSTLGTMLMVKGLIRGYHCFGFQEDLDKARKLLQLIMDKHICRKDGAIHVTYATGQDLPILNVYAFTAGTLSLAYSATKEQELLDVATEILEIVAKHQFDNGAWPFVAGEPYEKTQIDFHQGFILEGFCEYMTATEKNNSTFAEAQKKGFEYYWRFLFDEKGASRFRLHTKYPVDIHNQSEGIFVFSQYASFDKHGLDIATKIFDWTVDNMHDRRNGYFYYQKWPMMTNKISYMAWGQALMLVALSKYALQKKRFGNWDD